MTDVAYRSGVSKMTVSRVLNTPDLVHPDTRARVMKAIGDLNFIPNRAASALSSMAQTRVGLIYQARRGAFATEFLIGAFDRAALMNVELITIKNGMDESSSTVLEHIEGQRLDGFIVLPPLCDVPDLIQKLQLSNRPIVAIATEGLTDISTVHIDERAAARDMTRYILSLGHRRIGFILGDPRLTASAKRLSGLQDALSEAGIPFDPLLVARGLFSYRSGLDASLQLLSRDSRPTAIFASNDDMAAATLATAHRLGLDVPGQLTVCGFDDTPIAVTIWPELTTVRQPIEQMASEAIPLLVGLIRDWRSKDRTITKICLDYEMVYRESDARVAI